MAQQPVNHGSIPGDGLGESLFSAFGKVNANDAELFGAKTEFAANFAALPATGETGKIYVTLDDDAMYRWTGNGYDDLGGIQFVANAAALPVAGEALKVYVVLDTNRLYRWTGTAYTGLSEMAVDIAQYPGADFGAKFNAAVAANGKNRVRYFATGAHTLATPVDLTDSHALIVDLRGAWIHVNAANIIAFDCTDVEDMRFYYGEISGDAVNVPYAAILQGDSIGGGQDTAFFGESWSERNEFNGGTISGYWKYACWLNHGREISKWQGYNTNFYSTGYAMAMFRDASRLLIAGELVTVVSPYKGSLAAGGSPTKTWLGKTTLFSRGAKCDGLLFIQGSCNQSTFSDVEFRSTGEPAVVLYDDCGSNYEFRNVSARAGFDMNYPTISGFDFFYPANPTANIRDVRITGYFSLRHDTGGTPGYFIKQDVAGGAVTRITGEIVLATGMAYGIQHNSRGVAGQRVEGMPFVGNSYVQMGDNLLVSANDRVQLAGTSVVLRGASGATITKASGTALEYIGAATKCLAEGFKITTTTSGAGILAEGDNNTTRMVEVTSAAGDGIIIRGDRNRFDLCDVLACSGTAIRFDPNSASNNGGYNTIIGGRYVGNVVFEAGTGGGANAQFNRIIGAVIEGNVTFEAGTDNNKLVGCLVTGSVTNNGGAGNTVS